jgi:hypothetical protein
MQRAGIELSTLASRNNTSKSSVWNCVISLQHAIQISTLPTDQKKSCLRLTVMYIYNNKYYTGVIWFLMYVWLLKIIFVWWFFSFIILQLTVLTVYAFLYGKTYLVSWISSCLDVCSFFSFLLIFVTLSVKCSFSCVQYLFNLLDCYCDNSVVKPDLGLSLDLYRRCSTHFSFT